MKRIFFIAMITCLTQVACTRSTPSELVFNPLEGKWRMITVLDNSTGQSTGKPTSIQKDVDITFTSVNAIAGTFAGNTPTNDLEQNDYSVGPNMSLSIPTLSMTKVAETTWGSFFVDNIRSSKEYNFDTNGNLVIKTTKVMLTFRKL